jgi:hypothetical protein
MEKLMSQLFRSIFSIVVTFLLALGVTNDVMAENKLKVVRTSASELTVNLENSAPVSAIQFSVNARGDIQFMQMSIGSRAAAANWELYSYRKNDSTWNVVMLSPIRKPFDQGEGTLVSIQYGDDPSKTSDSVVVSLSRTEIVDPQAQILPLELQDTRWATRQQESPALFSFNQNFPNPFNPSTTISYTLHRPANVQLVIYDIAGREIKRLVSQYQFEGSYAANWESTDEAGRRVPSGVYVARLLVEQESAIRKMVLTK